MKGCVQFQVQFLLETEIVSTVIIHLSKVSYFIFTFSVFAFFVCFVITRVFEFATMNMSCL